MDLNQFIGKSQLSTMREACRGEEGAFFRGMALRKREWWGKVRNAISKAEGGK